MKKTSSNSSNTLIRLKLQALHTQKYKEHLKMIDKLQSSQIKNKKETDIIENKKKEKEEQEGVLQKYILDEEHHYKNIVGINDRIKYSQIQYEKETQTHMESERMYNALENSIVLLQSHATQMKNNKKPLIIKEKEVTDNLAGTYEELVDTQGKRRFNEGEISRLKGKANAIEKEIKSNENLARFYLEKISLLIKEIENFFFVDCHANTIYKVPKIVHSWIYIINRDQQFLFLRKEIKNDSQSLSTANLKSTTLNQIDNQKVLLLKKLKGEQGKNMRTDRNLNKKHHRMLIQNIQLVIERNTLFEAKQHLMAQEDNLLSKIVMSIEELSNLFPKFKAKLVGYLSNIYSSLDLTTGLRRTKSASRGYKAKGSKISELLSTANLHNSISKIDAMNSPEHDSADSTIISSDFSGLKIRKNSEVRLTDRRKSAPRAAAQRSAIKPKPIIDPNINVDAIKEEAKEWLCKNTYDKN